MFIKNKLKYITISVASLFLFSQATAVGMSNSWPVHDAETYSAIKALQDQLADSDGEYAKNQAEVTKNVGYNSAYSTNLNINNLAIAMEQRKKILEAAPTLEKCIETTANIGMGRLRAGYEAKKGAIETQVVKPSQAFGNANFNAVTANTPAIGACTVNDIREGINNCKGAKVGKYAGKDETVSVLSYNQLGMNRSIDSEQYKVGQQFIQNMIYGHAPPRPEGDMRNSNAYNAQRKIWNSRMSSASESLAHILAWNSEIPMSQTSSLAAIWNSPEINAVYSQVGNGQAKKPINPSMGELIEVLTNKDFMYGGGSAKEQSADTNELLRNLNKKVALSNFLANKQIQNQQDMIAMLASMLSIMGQQSANFGDTMQAGS